jgi:hypothetical protein
MKLPMTGGCLCGAVRYQILAEPVGAGNCHCRTCQKSVGAAYVPVLFVLYDALKITGNYKEYATTADSGNTMNKGFCPECGTALFGRNSATNKIRPVNAATLDEPGIYKPHMNFWVSAAQPRDVIDPNLPKFEKDPSIPTKSPEAVRYGYCISGDTGRNPKTGINSRRLFKQTD